MTGSNEGDGILEPPLLVRVVDKVVGDGMGTLFLPVLLKL